MPYTLKTQQISVKDPDSGEYIGVDVLTEQTKEGLIAELQAEGDTQVERINQAAVDVQSAVDAAEAEAQQIISDTQSSLDALEAQKNTIAETVASMAELGTDTTLTTPGMAADAKATGDEISNVKNAIGELNRQISDVEENQIPELKSAFDGNMNQLNSGNLLFLNGTFTRNGITVVADPTNYRYTITATSASEDDFVNLVYQTNSMTPFEKERDIYFRFKCTNAHVALRVMQSANGSNWSPIGTYYTSDDERTFQFANTSQGIILRIIVDKNNAVSGTFEMTFSYNQSNEELSKRITALDSKVDTNNTAINTKVNAIVETESTAILTIDSFSKNGYLGTNGEFVETSNNQWTTDYIPVELLVYYKLTHTVNIRTIWSYKADKSVDHKIEQITYDRNFSFKTYPDVRYVRININAAKTGESVNMYPVKDGLQTIKELSDDIIVPTKKDNTLHVGMRRPLIAFICDGDYDMNGAMHDVFANHNTICGYAPQYYTGFTGATLNDYLEWQDEGFEILSHGADNIGSSSTMTDDEAIASIHNSYAYLAANGFDPKGYIALNGNVKAKYIPEIAKVYDWGATQSNNYGSRESCIMYGTDRPYYLWRYSMQLSTLQQMKDAVDRCLSENALLLFYGHAQSKDLQNFTTQNLDALLTYIETVGGEIVRPSEAVKNYFTVRYDDIYNILNHN